MSQPKTSYTFPLKKEPSKWSNYYTTISASPFFPQFLRVIKSIFAFLQQWQAKEEKYCYYTMSGGVSCGCFPTLEIRIKDYLLLIIPLLSDFNLCMILWWYYYLGNQLIYRMRNRYLYDYREGFLAPNSIREYIFYV